MAEESFLLVSLEEDKAKKLAQVLSNDTSRKILDFLSKKSDATESDLSRDMGLPLSTVHYNLQLLVAASLVSADTFHYSEKGKEVLHYTLSNKYVIIAPKSVDKIREKLKQILPVFLIVGIASAAIQFFTVYYTQAVDSAAGGLMAAQQEIAAKAAPMAADYGIRQAPAQAQPFALWFLFGSVFAMLIYMFWTWALGKIKK